MNNRLSALCGLLVLGAASPAFAHGVRVEYQLTPDVEIQAKFDHGDPIAQAQVQIYRPDQLDEPWRTGKADRQGRFVFTPPPGTSGQWLVKVYKAGHGAVVKIPVTAPSPVTSQRQRELVSAEPQQQPSVALVAEPTAGGGLPPFQREIGSVLVIGGFVGTALYFWSRKR